MAARIDAGALVEAVVFDSPVRVADGLGGFDQGWQEQHRCRARFVFSKGGEAIEAARLQGKSVFKLMIRQCAAARSIAPDWRVRDERRTLAYNVREVDTVTDRLWIYVLIEGGVAV